MNYQMSFRDKTEVLDLAIIVMLVNIKVRFFENFEPASHRRITLSYNVH